MNELRVHKDLRYFLLVGSDKNYLQPQRHDKERIHPIKNITYITPLEGQNTNTENNSRSEQPQSDKPQPGS